MLVPLSAPEPSDASRGTAFSTNSAPYTPTIAEQQRTRRAAARTASSTATLCSLEGGTLAAMALSDAVAPLVRRWYIVLLGLILAGVLGWSAATLSPPKYTARGLVMILPSPESTGPKGNPLLNMSGLDLPARVLVAYYSSEPAQTDMAAFAPNSDIRVTMEEATRGPIIAIDVTDVTPSGAIQTLQHVAETIPPNLAQIQQSVGTPTRAAVGSKPLVLDTKAERDQSRTIQLVVAAVVAGLALTLLITYSIDGIVLRRAALKAESLEGSGSRSATPSSESVESSEPAEPGGSSNEGPSATESGDQREADGLKSDETESRRSPSDPHRASVSGATVDGREPIYK